MKPLSSDDRTEQLCLKQILKIWQKGGEGTQEGTVNKVWNTVFFALCSGFSHVLPHAMLLGHHSSHHSKLIIKKIIKHNCQIFTSSHSSLHLRQTWKTGLPQFLLKTETQNNGN